MLSKKVQEELEKKMPWHHKMFSDYINDRSTTNYIREQISWAYGKVSEDAYLELQHIKNGIDTVKQMNRWLNN